MRIKPVLLLTCTLMLWQSLAIAQIKNTISFDNDWLFHRGAVTRGEQTDFNDASWRKVDLPHDWSIEDLPGTQSPYSPDAISEISGGFTTQGTAWYRKTFTLPSAVKGKQVIIQFDGVYMNSDVFVNGHHIGNHPYGYTSFYYDITSKIKYGEKNVIAVEVKNEGRNSRWYSGSGIYRHVWLKTVDPVHIAQWGTFITTPEVSTATATVKVKTHLVNESNEAAELTVVTRFLTAAGADAGKTELSLSLAAGEEQELSQSHEIKAPQLWSPESPVLYKAVSEISRDGVLINSEETIFGIRSITVDVNNGLQLNGKTIKLKGGSVHNDNGPLGARTYDRAEERKIEILKANGFNAIRCSHNPPGPSFLAACDRLGMLVIDEAFDMWNKGKNPQDYHLYFKSWWQRDIESMVKRDRNHPSVIMWSIGNEIPEKGTPGGADTAGVLARFIKTLDNTRPVTAAVDQLTPDKDPYFAQLDVAGYNYAIGMGEYNTGAKDTAKWINIYEQSHQRIPGRIMMGTESFAIEAFANWRAVMDHPYVIGDFVWTAFDYMGEASIGWRGYPQDKKAYPWNLAYCGDIDICGWKRPQSYYRDAVWKQDQLSVFVKSPQPTFALNPQISPWARWSWPDVFADWNWAGYENKPMEVVVYSSCEKTELFLNGKSLGIKSTDKSAKFTATWRVPYQKGELKAVGYNGSRVIKTSVLNTAAAPAKIKLTADRNQISADGQDLSYITVELKDAKGIINPKADNLVNFTLTGDAQIVGVGNANPVSTESSQLPHRKAWKGRCLVIIKAGNSPGKIMLKASAVGLRSAEIDLTAK